MSNGPIGPFRMKRVQPTYVSGAAKRPPMMSWYVSHVVDEPVAARLTSKRSPSSTSPFRFASTNRSEPFRETPAASEVISSTIGNSEYAPSAPRYCSPPKSIQRANESMGAPAGRIRSDPWSGVDLRSVAGGGVRGGAGPVCPEGFLVEVAICFVRVLDVQKRSALK